MVGKSRSSSDKFDKIYNTAEKLSKKGNVSTFSLFKAIYSITKGLTGDDLYKRAVATQRQYIDSGRVKRYTTKNNSGQRVRYRVDTSQKYKLISDMISFIDNDLKTKKGPKSKLERNVASSQQDSVSKPKRDKRKKTIADYVFDYIQGKPLSKRYLDRVKRSKTEYSEFVKEIALETYCEGEDLDVMEIRKKPLNKSLVADLLGVRMLAVSLGKKLKGNLKKQGHLTDKDKIFNKKSEEVIRDEVEDWLAPFLFDFLEEFRKKHQLEIKSEVESKTKKQLDFSDLFEDDSLGEYSSVDEEEEYESEDGNHNRSRTASEWIDEGY